MFAPLTADHALFLDFDGTLVDIAPTPDSVKVTSSLCRLLARRQRTLGGAMAVVSGRSIADLDTLLQPLRFAAAGEHGAELRRQPEHDVQQYLSLPTSIRDAATMLASQLGGTRLELKGTSVSLHYRLCPSHRSAVTTGMQAIADSHPEYVLIKGKMVAELKPNAVDKGTAIRALCKSPLFINRQPVFIGDDVTDEPGFEAVNQMGGISIRVGEHNTSHACYSLPSVREVRYWLDSQAD